MALIYSLGATFLFSQCSVADGNKNEADLCIYQGQFSQRGFPTFFNECSMMNENTLLIKESFKVGTQNLSCGKEVKSGYN